MPKLLKDPHSYRVSLLFILAIALLVKLTILTTSGQVAPNFPIRNDDDKGLVVVLESDINNNITTQKILSITVDNRRYKTKPYWLKRDLQGDLTIADIHDFYEGEKILRSAVYLPSYIITEDNKRYDLSFTPLQWQDYSPAFYSSRLCAFIAMFFSLWIYYIAPQQRGTKAAVLGSYCFALACLMADKWIERQWAMDANILYYCIKLAELCGVFYTVSVFYLAWYLPKPLFKHPFAKYVPYLVFVIMLFMYLLNLFEIITNLFITFEAPYIFIHLTIIAILLYKFFHHYTNRGVDIIEWVAIRWVVLAMFIGISLPLCCQIMVFTGYLAKMPNFAFDSVVVFKVGLSALVASSVLYQAESLWWRLWVLIIAIGIFLLSYLAIMLFIDTTLTLSISIALMIALLAAFITTYFLKKRYALDIYKAMENVLPIMLFASESRDTFTPHSTNTSDPAEVKNPNYSSWVEALEYIFKPLSINYMTQPIAKNRPFNSTLDMYNRLQHNQSLASSTTYAEYKTDEDPEIAKLIKGGAYLRVINLDSSFSVELVGANNGLRLFTQRDINLIQAFWQIMQQHQKNQTAFIHGEVNERRRIAADLHDDIGGKLLYLASRRGPLGEYAHETLQDLRILARGLSSNSKPFEEVLADINYRLAEKCEIEAIEFDFYSDVDSVATYEISPRDATTLTIVLNELSRNALAHAKVSRIECYFTISKTDFNIMFFNNGKEVDMASWRIGMGIQSIKRRIYNWQGVVNWKGNIEGGATCIIQIPLSSLF